ncbi:MAG: helix-turn-helix domain-containing protein [Solirubrobacteraceae bacterium]
MGERGMTQTALARNAGLDVRQVSALVCGQSNPTYLTLLRLCDGLQIPLSEMMRRVETLPSLNQHQAPDNPRAEVEQTIRTPSAMSTSVT